MEGLNQFLPILAMLVVVYLFMIRPQAQRQKKEKKFAEELKKGTKVVTKSGLHGRVADISEKLNAVKTESIKRAPEYNRFVLSRAVIGWEARNSLSLALNRDGSTNSRFLKMAASTSLGLPAVFFSRSNA